MNIGFYLTAEDVRGYVYADYLIANVRETMPGVSIYHFTDMTSPAVATADAVQRLPKELLCLARAKHYQVDGEWLFVDTDVVIQRDVRDIFNQPFDIAVTDRQWDHIAANPSDKDMPYCTGIVFSRNPRVWEHVYGVISRMSTEDQRWYGEQKAITRLHATTNWTIHVLPGMIFQYPPEDSQPHPGAILHYKGKRKDRLMERIHRELMGVR